MPLFALTYLELAAYGLGLGACWAGFLTGAATFYAPVMEALDFCVECGASIEFNCPRCGAITIGSFECQMIALMR
jgi:hypothetical protein